jgi:hypothetical protein
MSMMKMEGSESGSISKRHGSADSDTHQNVIDPQHWLADLTIYSGLNVTQLQVTLYKDRYILGKL